MSDEKFQNKYRVKSARATWHDYSGGAYFITVCTKNREHSFGEICNVETWRAASQSDNMTPHDVETRRATSLQRQINPALTYRKNPSPLLMKG